MSRIFSRPVYRQLVPKANVTPARTLSLPLILTSFNESSWGRVDWHV